MVVRRDARIAFATVLTLGLCAAITAPARTSSATYGTGGVGTATVGGSGTLGTGGTTNRAATPNASGGRLLVNVAVPTESTATASGGIGKTTSASSASSGVAGGAARASAGVVAPVGLDAGAVRPTWHEAEVVLTVDPSYLALPYAKRALEGALLAWTTMAD